MTANKQQDNKMLQELISVLVENKLLCLKEEHPQRLRDIFLNPAKDLASTFGYAVEKLSASAQKVIKGLTLIIPTLIIPGLEFRYDLFAKDEQKRLDAIKKKYGDALARNWEAIKDPDVFGFMLLAYPQAMLGFSALKKSPLAFLRVLEVATGGMEPVRVLRQNLESTAGYAPRQTQNIDPAARGIGDAGGGMTGDYYGDYGGIFENQTTNPQQSPEAIAQVQQLLQRPDVQQALQNSQLFRDMQGQAVSLLVSPVIKLGSSRSVNDLAEFIKPEALTKAKQQIMNNPDYKNLPEQEKKQTDELFFKLVKDTYKAEYLKWLASVAQQKPEMANTVAAAIQQIKAVK